MPIVHAMVCTKRHFFAAHNLHGCLMCHTILRPKGLCCDQWPAWFSFCVHHGTRKKKTFVTNLLSARRQCTLPGCLLHHGTRLHCCWKYPQHHKVPLMPSVMAGHGFLACQKTMSRAATPNRMQLRWQSHCSPPRLTVRFF